ncbi:MAG: glycosyltransferase [Lentisphaeria bacterium]|nr:glycosyltransferase [Lentisphaeria bacterium]
MDKIAVLIPCYNEAATIRQVVSDFHTQLPDAVIYVYDNNSTDDTAAIAADAGAIVRHEYKQGKGNVIRRMFREIDAECYLMVDGDATYPADAAPAMCQYIFDRQADMVIGDRLSSTYFQENKRLFHGFGNRLVRYTINRLFHANIRDIMTGYRAFSYHFVKTFPVLSCGFELETEMTIHAVSRDLNIVNHIIDYKDRPEGSESKLNTCRDGIRVLLMILRLWKDAKPLQFFSAIAAFLLLVSMILLVPVFIEYFQTGLVRRFPTLFVGCCGGLAAFQAFYSGLQLSTYNKKARSDFEYQLKQTTEELRRKKRK